MGSRRRALGCVDVGASHGTCGWAEALRVLGWGRPDCCYTACWELRAHRVTTWVNEATRQTSEYSTSSIYQSWGGQLRGWPRHKETARWVSWRVFLGGMVVPGSHAGLLAVQLSEDAPPRPDLQLQAPPDLRHPQALLGPPLEPPWNTQLSFRPVLYTLALWNASKSWSVFHTFLFSITKSIAEQISNVQPTHRNSKHSAT